MKNLYAVDVETTGTDPRRHSLLSVGVVSIADPTQTFYGECRIWDGANIEQEALNVNGFSAMEAVDQNKQSESDLVKELYKWLPEKSKLIMVAHNAAFDRDFLAEAFKRADGISPFSFRTIDVHSIVYMHMLRTKKDIPQNLSLNNCLKAFGLPPEPNPHNALTGAQCNVALFNSVLAYDGSEQQGIF
jgi:DNA polymerase III epsilon subunit-like protein